MHGQTQTQTHIVQYTHTVYESDNLLVALTAVLQLIVQTTPSVCHPMSI